MTASSVGPMQGILDFAPPIINGSTSGTLNFDKSPNESPKRMLDLRIKAKERSMNGYRPSYLPQLFLIGLLSTLAASTPAAESQFAPQFGGYLVSTDFRIDSNNHAVIYLPVEARSGDLLSIRPLRLNNNEYLILQKCDSPDCTRARVVRAWNALGRMGHDLLMSNKIPIESGARYMLWMQHISTQGGYSFSLYKENSPPLVLIPEGPPELFEASDLLGAREHGPTRIQKSYVAGMAFMTKFDGGSVVKLQLLRAKNNVTAALR